MLASRSKGGNSEVKEKIGALERRCREQGLRITPQRIAVYKALLESEEHPSAEVVFRKIRGIFPNISLDTVNRTLLTLSRIGAASIIEGSGDARRFDGNLESHQHFKCIKCKRIIDFHHKPFENIKLPAGVKGRFVILRKTVYLEGICDLCRKKSEHK